jgi:hypothetical protein
MMRYLLFVLLIPASQGLFAQYRLKQLKLPPIGDLSIGHTTKPAAGTGSNPELLSVNYITCNSNCGILPVQDIKLSASRINGELVKLNWETKGEFDSRGFDMEYALAFPDKFLTAGFLPSNLNANFIKKYGYDHENGFEGVTYYRIKQIDLDGKFLYSNVVKVPGIALANHLTVYPNPASDLITARIFSKASGPAQMVIMDGQSRELIHKTLLLEKGYNRQAIALQSFPAGVYFLLLEIPDQSRLFQKFVISR